MTTQALLVLIAAVLLTVVAGVPLAGWYADRRRDPHDVVAVVSVGTARHALALVDRLERTDPDDAAAARHLASVITWAGPERSHGIRRHRRAAAELYAAATQRRVARELPESIALTPEGARRGWLHLATGGRRDELGEVVECNERADLGGMLGPDRHRTA